MDDITKILSDFIEKFNINDISDSTVDKTKQFIADYFISAIAGYGFNDELNNAVLDIVRHEKGIEEATILFEDRKYPISVASYVNGIFSHGADIDDGNKKSAGHIATHVMSAVFAVAESGTYTWAKVFEAIITGYEVFNRVVAAGMPSMYNKGFHSTGIGGGIACAAACGKLYGLNSKELYNAISLASFQSNGLIIIDETGQGAKPINPANAARIGVQAAQLAKRGVSAPLNPLQSKKGWFNAFCDEVNEKFILDDLGKVFTIDESYLKIYPTCRHTHCAMESVLHLRKIFLEKDINMDTINRVNVFIYPSAIKSTGSINYPKTKDEAKFSMSYCIATILEKGKFNLEELNCEVSDFAKGIIEKIHLIPDPSFEDREKGIRGVNIEITLENEETFEHYLPFPNGEGKKSFKWEDLKEKMVNYSCDIISLQSGINLIDTIENIKLDSFFEYPIIKR